jgi:hypothetical protein
MSAEQPPGSPFRPDADPLGVRRSPFAPGYEPAEAPRLGIVHLLAATACVAFYLGLMQSAERLTQMLAEFRRYPSDDSLLGRISQASTLFYGLGAGIALGGLPLWVARRVRGMRFPRHPGEYILVVVGIAGLLNLGEQFVFVFVSSLLFGGGLNYSWFVGIIFVLSLAVALLWFVAARRVAIRAWRRYFYLCAGATLLADFASCGSFRSGRYVVAMLTDAILVWMVVREHRRGLRYPWSHWVGVGVKLWFGLLSLAWFVLTAFFWERLMMG